MLCMVSILKLFQWQHSRFLLISFSTYSDANENKAHPDHIQTETNGFPISNITSNGRINSPAHKTSRLNGVVPRMNMNITPNPLANDGDKVIYWQ